MNLLILFTFWDLSSFLAPVANTDSVVVELLVFVGWLGVLGGSSVDGLTDWDWLCTNAGIKEAGFGKDFQWARDEEESNTKAPTDTSPQALSQWGNFLK